MGKLPHIRWLRSRDRWQLIYAAATLVAMGLLVACSDEIEAISQRRDVIKAGLSASVEIRTACSVGSGFFFMNEGDAYVLTNAHVIAGRDDESCTKGTTLQTKRGDKFGFIAYQSDSSVDLAVLKVVADRSKLPSGIDPLIIDPKRPVKGQAIVAVGSPNGGGLVALDGQLVDANLSWSGRMEMNISVQPGNSGGPVISKASGLVVGVVVAREQDAKGPEGVSNGRSFAIGVAQIKSFMKDVNWSKLRSATCSSPTCEPFNQHEAPGSSGEGTPQNPSNPNELEPGPSGTPMPEGMHSGFEAAAVRAAALSPTIYAALVAVVLLWSRLPAFALCCMALVLPALYYGGNWLLNWNAVMSASQSYPWITAAFISWVGVAVVAHLLFRACLLAYLFVNQASALDSRGIRLKTAMLFRPRVAVSLLAPILTGSWAWIAYETVWLAK
ncbi:S1C family serine protease [Paucibacter sp. JuS9]|uniref:S1C family serine protease n=1 Tax=Paucibacter sp. JuS9 TaxID=3228748 RepID=UPI0037580A83